MAVLTVDNTPLTKVGSVMVNVTDLDSSESGRNQSGYFFRDRVRGGSTSPRKIEVAFLPMTWAEISAVLQLIGGASMSLRYPDPYTGAYRTATVYVGDRKAPILDVDSTDVPRWSGLTVNFIEY
ncbi:MAG: hypothetical protein IKE23_07005 [Exiguobacterium sp.]|nr:hypothetical protein [Exiguobacterium sp.]